MLSAVDISRIVEVDKATLRPNGINMTEEELVALAYEIRPDAKTDPGSPDKRREKAREDKCSVRPKMKTCPNCDAAGLLETRDAVGAIIRYYCPNCNARLLVLA
jgi:hypothetical protein